MRIMFELRFLALMLACLLPVLLAVSDTLDAKMATYTTEQIYCERFQTVPTHPEACNHPRSLCLCSSLALDRHTCNSLAVTHHSSPPSLPRVSWNAYGLYFQFLQILVVLIRRFLEAES